MTRIDAIVLAAGASTRLGKPKQLLELDGVPLVRRAAIAASDAGASQVVVILGAGAKTIAPALDGLDDVTVLINPNWQSGISESLATGVRHSRSCDAVLITLADQPFVSAFDLRLLIAAFDARRRIIASQYGEIVGVPAVVAREHFDALVALRGDRGAGNWLRRRGDVTTVPLGGAILDIDTPEDAARLGQNVR